jgi:choline dehydrogenase-like flavoprotein
MNTRQLRAPARRVVLRLAEVACGSEVRQPELADALLADFDALLGVLRAGARRLLRAGLTAFNQGSRLYPPARGRKFAALSDDRAEAYYLAVKRGRLGPGLQLIKGLVVFSYYELPSVKEQLGYRPDAYIADVSRRRLDGILLTAVNLPPSLIAMSLPGHGRELAALMADYNHMVTAGCLVEDTGTGRVRNVPGLGPQVTYQLTEDDTERVLRGVARTAELMFAAGARRVLLPFEGAPAAHDPAGVTEVLARPAARKSIELFTVHVMGTARMSADPRRGVVDSFGAFYGVPGLFVADASLFPSPIGVNPMETILALAVRNARQLVSGRAAYGI